MSHDDSSDSDSNSNAPKSCVPCKSLDDSALLSIDQVKAQMMEPPAMPFWSLEQTDDGVACLCRQYTAKNFQAALDSINAMGVIAERENHHPDFSLTNYRQVKVVLWTHKVGGITQNDLTLAKMIDAEVEIVYSPKWLRENHPNEETKKES